MGYIIILIIIIGLIIKGIYDGKEKKKKLIKKLKESWGQVPDEEYTQEKYDSITKFYRSYAHEQNDVDDITWNDIDMDQIYMLMNNTSSAIGEEYLYYVLRKLQFEDKHLKERNRLSEYFANNTQIRMELQVILSAMGKLKSLSVYEYINRTTDLEEKKSLPHYLMAFGLIFSVISIFVIGPIGVMPTFAFVGLNIVTYYSRKAEIEPYFTVFSYIIRMLNNIDEINKLKIKELEPYVSELSKTSKIFKRFRKNSKLLTSGKSMSGDLADMLLDYIRMLFHVDLIKFDSMLHAVKKNQEALNQMYEHIGLLDSMIAVASFKEMLEYSCVPTLFQDKKPFLDVKELYHPLIDEPVATSFFEARCLLITGSNASGKSTFLKTVAINAILAQTIYISLSKSYEASYFNVYSSMALSDNLFSNESYYIVEIKSLKRILDSLDKDVPMLCFVDEVLRGTNTVERISASSQILKSFAVGNAICFAATHDIELTHILEQYYSNYHFQEQIKDDNILFDYQLLKGRAVTKNAIKLLGIIGYSDQIIEDANETANGFLENGIWKTLS